MPRVGLEEVMSPASAQSVAKSAAGMEINFFVHRPLWLVDFRPIMSDLSLRKLTNHGTPHCLLFSIVL